MVDMAKDVPLEQALNDYRHVLDKVEPVLEKWWQEAPSLGNDDPLARLMESYFQRWEKLRELVNAGADADYKSLFADINEIADWLPGLETTPFLHLSLFKFYIQAGEKIAVIIPLGRIDLLTEGCI